MAFYIKLGIMYQSVVVHSHAIDDIRLIASSDKKAASAILVALEHLKVDPKTTIDILTTHGSNELANLNLSVKKWQSAKSIGNLWRLRVMDSPATTHRIIYGFHYQTQQLCILAIVNKENYDYDDLTSEINRRIISDWRAI
jgi:hypothetical protein